MPPARLVPSLASPFLLQRGNNKWLTPFLLGLQEERRLAAVSSRHHMVAGARILTPQAPRHPYELALRDKPLPASPRTSTLVRDTMGEQFTAEVRGPDQRQCRRGRNRRPSRS